MTPTVIVIRAGGSGSRLWPLSTADMPKQFIPVLSEQSLLQETFERVREFGADNIFVTTNVRYVGLVAEQIPELALSHIIAEPLKRNTGPGIAFETAMLREFFPEADPIIASIPSDDHVAHPRMFVDSVRQIAAHLRLHPEHIVMPVIAPEAIDPGFSYVRAVGETADAEFGEITDWVEKPDIETCGAMLESGEWFAHTGMYFWQLSTVSRAFEEIAPDVWRIAQNVAEAVVQQDSAAAAACAAEFPIISIESLLTKQFSNKASYQAGAWGWSDVGKWLVVKSLLAADADSNAASCDAVKFVNSQNNLVYSAKQKPVVCVGVENLVIVETAKHLLVCHASESHRIGAILEDLGTV